MERSVAVARLVALDMTQVELADRCDLELRTLQRWLAGGRVRLDDAERVASALGVGTSEICAELPDDRAVRPFAMVRSALRVLSARQGTVAHNLRTVLGQFGFIDEYAAFTGHPRRGYVRRIAMAPERAHRFGALGLSWPAEPPTRLVLGAQISRRFRYDFAEITLDAGRAELVEFFHTRSCRAPLSPAGTLDLRVWISSEMRELVLVGDRDFRVSDHPEWDDDVLDLGAPRARHAVCSRPASVHLRERGLPCVFDRVVGPREGRLDVVSELEGTRPRAVDQGRTVTR